MYRERYEDKWEHDIKESQCVDQTFWWHLVRKVRKSLTTKVDPILDDNGDVVVDIPEIANTWATYNHRLTTPDNHEDSFKD